MPKISHYFGLNKSQFELDFVDVATETDTKLFVDPFALSLRTDPWGREAHALLLRYFERLLEAIREGRAGTAIELLSHLSEPNETRLGLSSGMAQGAGIGPVQANQLFFALANSEAVKTGFLTSLAECELMIPQIGNDKISDLTTNVIRKKLAEYTQQQCDLHGIATVPVAVGPHFSEVTQDWESEYHALPIVDGEPILFVPKSLVRRSPAYSHQNYYRHHVLNFLRAENLSAGTSLVRSLANGKRKVFKKDLEVLYPCTKEFLFEFSKNHPNVLQAYRQYLEEQEIFQKLKPLGDQDVRIVAAALQAALQSIIPGSETASEYHRLMIGIVEFLFYPHLVNPRKEQEIHEGRKRIDIAAENSASAGPFFRLHDVRRIPCSYIFIECKNYTREIANPELDQLSGRFSVNRGKVGLLLCRSFERRDVFVQRCRDTFQDGRGLILAIHDQIVLEMLDCIRRDARGDIMAILTRLIDEVCLG